MRSTSEWPIWSLNSVIVSQITNMADIDDMLLFEDFANLADNSRKSRWFKDRVDLFE